ncbi:histidine phosphatase superfamily [Lasiosphaeria hispida]|uniref:Histidine phosphatase superfamily n=1 Tax=Lasiosphaeria hispida TaxID=260671 RepID=A0AAJ0HGI3_9PEZI|nr:histidine phosphatase superfamily [Lasiosphaeria hispida]
MASTPKHLDTQTHVENPTTIHILRHGESLHNIQKPYPHPDPPLTETGTAQALALRPASLPDLILISPMTRTIQTALLAFSHLLGPAVPLTSCTEVQIWPDLREARHEICNKGVSRAELAARFPGLDFGGCREQWDYPPDAGPGEAEVRAERVRGRLAGLRGYGDVWVVTHRGFLAYLVQGERFGVCEHRRYRFATEGEDGKRHGVNRDTVLPQDFGPTLLVPVDE